MSAFKIRMLGGAAFCLFAMASAAFAQQVDPTQYSTPAEKQQTRELNLQGIDGTYASPDRLNGQTPQAYGNATPIPNERGAMPAVPELERNYRNQSPPDEPSAGTPPEGPQSNNQSLRGYRRLAARQNMPDQSAPDDQPSDRYPDQPPPDQNAPAQYGQPQEPSAPPVETPPATAAQQQYQDRMQQYRARQDEYRAQRAQYEHDMRRYDVAAWRFADYPRPYPYRYDNRLWRIYLIEDPAHQLAQAPIEGPDGAWVGKVRNVEINPGGQPLRIEVALNRRVSVWVSPGHFRYDPAEHIVYTDLTRDELWNYPGATVESSYWP